MGKPTRIKAPWEALVFHHGLTSDKDWSRAKAMLLADASLMTSQVLLGTLKNRPPFEVVQFMLSRNQLSAAIPREGPTALQIAVHHDAPVNTVKLLLKACPFALVASTSSNNKDDYLPPLESAKRFRPTEADLIDVLTKPLSYWLKESNDEFLYTTKKEESIESNHTREADKKELDNIKAIAATIVRTQKRQMQALTTYRHEIENSTFDKDSLLTEMEQNQKKYFKTQLIALNMQEKAMRHKTRTMERRIIRSMEDSKQRWHSSEARQETALLKLEQSVNEFGRLIGNWKAEAEGRMRALEGRFQQEFEVNEFDTRMQQLDLMEQAFPADASWSPYPFQECPVQEERDEASEPLFGRESTAPMQHVPPRRMLFWNAKNKRHRKFDRLLSA